MLENSIDVAAGRKVQEMQRPARDSLGCSFDVSVAAKPECCQRHDLVASREFVEGRAETLVQGIEQLLPHG